MTHFPGNTNENLEVRIQTTELTTPKLSSFLPLLFFPSCFLHAFIILSFLFYIPPFPSPLPLIFLQFPGPMPWVPLRNNEHCHQHIGPKKELEPRVIKFLGSFGGTVLHYWLLLPESYGLHFLAQKGMWLVSQNCYWGRWIITVYQYWI